MEVYVWVENSSKKMKRLIHEFCLSCQQQETDQVDRSVQRKKIMNQLFVELEKKDTSVALDEDEDFGSEVD